MSKERFNIHKAKSRLEPNAPTPRQVKDFIGGKDHCYDIKRIPKAEKIRIKRQSARRCGARSHLNKNK